jgi:uncharacterized protein YaiI (UPF0178 family)
MKIWVDADACPKAVKNILYKAADRLRIPTTFVANGPLRLPESKNLFFLLVDRGFDVADQKIVELIQSGDLVITADIPLAAEVVEKGAFALNPRGDFYTKENVRDKLAMRNLMSELRDMGEVQGGPSSFSNRDKQAFAAKFDAFLTKHS